MNQDIEKLVEKRTRELESTNKRLMVDHPHRKQ